MREISPFNRWLPVSKVPEEYWLLSTCQRFSYSFGNWSFPWTRHTQIALQYSDLGFRLSLLHIGSLVHQLVSSWAGFYPFCGLIRKHFNCVSLKAGAGLTSFGKASWLSLELCVHNSDITSNIWFNNSLDYTVVLRIRPVSLIAEA